MININIDLNARDAARFMDAAPRLIFNAQRSAIGTTTTFATRLMKQRMEAITGLPGKVFKQYRVKSRVSDKRGIVFLGFNPVKAAYAGKLKQQEAGAMAGQYYFEKGFVAKMHSGHVSIFKRKGKKRFPLVEQMIQLPKAQAITEQVADEAAIEFQRRYVEYLTDFINNLL